MGVFVQADCRDEEALGEVNWVAQLATDHPFIRGIVAYAPVHLGSDARSALYALSAESLVVGVRRLLQGRPSDEIVNGRFIEGVRLLATYGMTFDICVTHDQLPAVAELVRACPQTSFVLDHLGKPPVANQLFEEWRTNISAIAKLPNVVLKLSGLLSDAGQRLAEADIRAYLEHGIESFGPRRCMLGSDWPLVLLCSTAGQWFDLVLSLVNDHSADERAAILRGTALRTYGLAPAANAMSPDDSRAAPAPWSDRSG